MGGASGINIVQKYFSGVNAPHVRKKIPPLARIRRTDLKANTMNISLRKRGRQTMGYSGDSNSVTEFSRQFNDAPIGNCRTHFFNRQRRGVCMFASTRNPYFWTSSIAAGFRMKTPFYKPYNYPTSSLRQQFWNNLDAERPPT